MSEKDVIRMSQKELKRLHVIHKVLEEKLKQIDAAHILGISDRQIRRIVKRAREEGDEGIMHKSRGRGSNRALPKKTKERVIKLYRERYRDFGPTLAREKLIEINKIKIGIQTLRNWLIEEGVWQVTHRRRKHRMWRQRKYHFGEMIQIDGSHHKWFEDRGPECVLMGYVDDATGTVYVRFYEYEGTVPAMDSFKRYVKKYGIPYSIYLDKHTTYKSTAKPTIEEELNGEAPLSQFGRAVKELRVEVIYAHSPQAKGRIERLFNTFQDRLIKEMRIRGIKNIEEANKFLETYLLIYNKRFSIAPMEKGDFHRPLPKDMDLNCVLCMKTECTLRNDFTIVYDKNLYQIMDKVNAKKVTVEKRINGRMFITYKGKCLKYKKIMQRPKRQEKSKELELFEIKKKPYIPPKNHPWRRFRISRYPKSYPC